MNLLLLYETLRNILSPTFRYINFLLINATIQADIPPEVAMEEGGWQQFVDVKDENDIKCLYGIPNVSSDRTVLGLCKLQISLL